MSKISKEKESRQTNLDAFAGGIRPAEARERMSRIAKERWADPEYRERMSRMAKERWADPEYRERMSRMAKETWADPEYREKRSKAHKKRSKSPAYRKKISKARKKPWEDPKFRDAQSKRIKALWEDPEFRERMSGENHPNFKGSARTTIYHYPVDFDGGLKYKIRERDGSRCVLCDYPDGLVIHHINYDKKDLRLENLITLCRTCHGTTNANRDKWESFFNSLIKLVVY